MLHTNRFDRHEPSGKHISRNKSLKCNIVILTLLTFLCSCLLTGCFFQDTSKDTAKQINYTELAITATQSYMNQDVKAFRKLMSKDFKKEVSAPAIQLDLYNLTSMYGSFRYYEADGLKTANQEGSVVARIPCTMDNGNVLLSFIFNTDGKIINYYWVDGATPSVSPILSNDIEVSFGSSEYPVQGCLTLPSGVGPFPCVILLQNLDYGDMNEQIGPNMPFRDIADQLSAQGIAVLRYNRRDAGFPTELASLDDYSLQDFIFDDLSFAMDFLKEQDNILNDNIYLAGHGVSGYLLPLSADYVSESAGYILLSAPARKIEQVIYDQNEYVLNSDTVINAKSKKTLMAAIEDSMDKIASLKANSAVPKEELLGLPVSAWNELNDYQPLQRITAMNKPILIIQGGRDYQTNIADFEAWKNVTTTHDMNNVSLLYFDNLNHLYMSGTGKSLPAEYQQSGTVSKDVTDSIASFIRNQLPVSILQNLIAEETESTPIAADATQIIHESLLNENGVVLE